MISLKRESRVTSDEPPSVSHAFGSSLETSRARAGKTPDSALAAARPSALRCHDPGGDSGEAIGIAWRTIKSTFED